MTSRTVSSGKSRLTAGMPLSCFCFGIRYFSAMEDRKSTRLNSSHSQISYAVFCLKKKKNNQCITIAHEQKDLFPLLSSQLLHYASTAPLYIITASHIVAPTLLSYTDDQRRLI